MEWISTKIRFPEVGEEVLTACRNKNMEDGIWLYDLCYYYPDTGWENRDNWEDVLYWTYIDEPNVELNQIESNGMTREEAYKFLEESSSNTQCGLYVHITKVEKAIKAVSDDEELIKKALDGIYECEGNSLDWMQLDDAKDFIDIALGIKDEFSYFK